MKYAYHPRALSEYAEAALFYEARRPGLGGEFIEEFEAALRSILAAPASWPVLEADIRRCLVKRFPFGVLYAIEPGSVKIIAVMHLSRRPGYWHSRRT